MVSSIKNNRPTTTTPATTTPSTTSTTSTPDADADAEVLSTGAGSDVVARRAAIDAVTGPITAEMRGLVVTDAEARTAVAQLKSLPPKDALLALHELQIAGSLDTLANNVDDGARKDLVTLMIASGFVGSEAGRVTGASPGGPTPPTAPTFAKQQAGLSQPLKALVREENIARADGFRDAFDDYRSDYQRAVRGAKTFEALRTIGPIAEPTLPIHEPGTKSTTDHEWSKRASTSPDTKTARIVTDTVFRINGKSPPGTDFYFEGTVKKSFGDLGFEGKASYAESRSGAVTEEASFKAKSKVPTGVPGAKAVVVTGVGVSQTEGVLETKGGVQKGGLDLSSPAGSMAIVSDGKRTEFEAKGQGAEAKYKQDAHGFELEVATDGAGLKTKFAASSQTVVDDRGHQRTTIKGTVGIDGVTATGGLDSDGGVVMGLGVDTDNVEGQLEFTTQLTSTADYARAFAAIEGDAFSNPPPELARGVKWSGLNADEQAAYTHYGWDQQRWEGSQKQSSSLASARVVGR